MTWVGKSVRRAEDSRLLSGNGRFVDDIDVPGALHVRVVRSQVASGSITGIDTTDSLALHGVIGVFTGADLATVPRIPIRLAASASKAQGALSSDRFLQPVLAVDEVRYVGEPVAVVVAEDPYVAEDAAELVTVAIAERPAVVSARPPSGCSSHPHSEAACLTVGYGAVEEAFERCRHRVSCELNVGRHGAVPLECRGLVAAFDQAAGRLEMWGPTKVPNFARSVIADAVGLPASKVHVNRVDVGGGFGARGEVYPEDIIVPWLSKQYGRPVKWIEDRAEHLVASNQSRDQLHRIEAAFDADGRLLAIRDEVWHDNGAYLRTHGVAVPELTITMLPGPYRVPAYAATIHVGLTNKTPCGTYRAPGRYEGTFVREHLLDVAASQLGIDRIELRRRNLLSSDELPHQRPMSALGTEMVLDAGDYLGLLDQALDHFCFAEWEAEAERRRKDGVLAGVGVGFFLEKSGLGPFDPAAVSIDVTGAVQVVSGGTSLGQGLETVLAQIAADELGVSPNEVEVVHSDSSLSPDGTGSWASRSTVLSGSAVQMAAQATADQARRTAATMLEADAPDIVLENGRAFVRGTPQQGLSLGELAAARRPGGPGWAGESTRVGLGADAVFEAEHMTYPYGVHLAFVEVDGGTGLVRILRYAIAYEVGRAINPQLVVGQLRGGAAQGIGGALLEEFSYTAEGQPQSTSFIDYMLPTAAEVPAVETLVLEMAPSSSNPLGAKGAGEGGLTGCGAAVASAVRAALGREEALPGLPLTPDVIRHALDNTDLDGRTGGLGQAT